MDDGNETTKEALSVDSVDEVKKPIKTIHFGHSKVKTFKASDTSYAKALTKNQKKKPTAEPTQILDDNKMVVDLIASLPDWNGILGLYNLPVGH